MKASLRPLNPEERAAEKQRIQREQEEADLMLAMEAFGECVCVCVWRERPGVGGSCWRGVRVWSLPTGKTCCLWWRKVFCECVGEGLEVCVQEWAVCVWMSDEQ